MQFRFVVLSAVWAVVWFVDTEKGAADAPPMRCEQATQRVGQTADDAGSAARLFGSAMLNPSGAAPLTAEIPFTPDVPGTLSMTITCPEIGEEGEEAISERFSFTAGKRRVLPVLGLYPDCVNRVAITIFDENGDQRGSYTQAIATNPLPDDFPDVTATGSYRGKALTFVTYFRARVKTEREEEWDGGPRIMQRFAPEITGIMFDKMGRVRWYSDFPCKSLFPMEFIDGRVYGGSWGNDGDMLQWYDLMGRRVGTVDLGAIGFARVHHDVIKKPDGNLIITADKIGGDYVEDHLIEIDPADGKLVHTWDLTTVLPDVADLYRDVPMTGPGYPGFTNDPVHVNGVAYDASDGGIVVTSQRSGVAKVRSDGTLAWLLAPHLTRYIDDADGDAVSDSFTADYDPSNRRTWVGDYTGDGYVHERIPIAGKPTRGYPFDFNYGEFLLTPVDRSGKAITDPGVLLGFDETPDFRWPFRPHAPRLMKDGTLLLLDNGFSRGFRIIGKGSFSRAALFKVTPDDDGYGGTVTQTAEYILAGKPRWHRFSAMVSEADELAGGTLLITLGGLGSGLYPPPIMDSYGDGPRGAYVAEVDMATGNELHSLLIERVIDEDHPNAPFSVYRAERIDPYQALGSTDGLIRLTTAQ